MAGVQGGLFLRSQWQLRRPEIGTQISQDTSAQKPKMVGGGLRTASGSGLGLPTAPSSRKLPCRPPCPLVFWAGGLCPAPPGRVPTLQTGKLRALGAPAPPPSEGLGTTPAWLLCAHPAPRRGEGPGWAALGGRVALRRPRRKPAVHLTSCPQRAIVKQPLRSLLLGDPSSSFLPK